MHDIKYKPKRGRVRRASPEMAAYVRQIASDNAGEHSRLKRNLIRVIKGNHIPDPELQRAQTIRHGDAGFGLDTAIVDQPHTAAFRFHHPPAHERIARVDAQHDHSPLPFPFHR